ncbi:PAS/PAC sensor signal transduction histidine kinase [Salinarchaeum sp. Harcht-Bsk1]|uniref:ATP-binding protein n=1 Tax=Salinarchaeum sp. Harcht-Bsk1 TaxID=1333523 RepID=UPI0003423250|nr:ATP-binding protein [Salinarchaeum sp. Harcht-Bsk1]AGN00985.1 PAS/PAC sensor signal transduction histidine kinase [Salinarchaeum sp. Harcht-Bsk1]
MSSPLHSPSRGLVVTTDEALADALEAALLGGRLDQIDVASDAAAALQSIDAEAAQPVGCVLVTDAIAAESPPDVVAELRGSNGRLPILVVGDDARDAWRATAAGADGFVPREPPEALRETVDERIEAYERRRWEAADSAALEALLATVQGSVYVKDAEARHLRKSREQGDIPPEEAIGKTDAEIYDEATYQEDLDVLRTGEGFDAKSESFETTDGTHWLETSKHVWRDDDGEIAGLVGYTEDVTDSVERQERIADQQRRLEAVAESYTHDLRTPLSLATGYLEQARMTGEEEFLDEVEDALERIDEMLDDLKAVATSEDEDVAETREAEDPLPSTSLASVARDVWRLTGTDAATLDLDFPESTVVQVAPGTLRTVLENLFKNAVQHAGDDVTVQVTCLDEDGGFAVEDDGPGIPAADRDAVLERGFSTSDTGTGVGLGLVSEIADRLEWDVRVTESESGGARIELANCPTVQDPPSTAGEWTQRNLDSTATIGYDDEQSEASTTGTAGQWTVTGAGRSIIEDVNEFQFAYGTVEPPVRIEARIADLEAVSEWSFGGVMVRSAVDPDAAYAGIGPSVGRGTTLLWRPAPDELGVGQAVADAADTHDWARLEVADGTVTASVSRDGTDWTPVDQRRVALEGPIHAGIAVCSTIPGEHCTATFESVSLCVRSSPDP